MLWRDLVVHSGRDVTRETLELKFAPIVAGLNAAMHYGLHALTNVICKLKYNLYPDDRPVNVHGLVFDLARRMENREGQPDNGPVLRNRGYQDLQWWPLDKLQLLWEQLRGRMEDFMQQLDVYGAFHHPSSMEFLAVGSFAWTRTTQQGGWRSQSQRCRQRWMSTR